MEEENPIFIWLQQHIPSISESINSTDQELKNERQFDNFYLDVSEIFLFLFKKLTFQTLEKLGNEVFKLISNALHLIKPRNILFIALDGSLPSELFRYQKENLIRFGVYDGKNIGLNHVIAGSKEIDEFEKYIKCKISEFILLESNQFKVVFSGSQVQGDGMSKISDFIRRQRG